MQVNSSLSQIQQLFQQRRHSLTEMISSVQSGDITTAQKDLASVQSADTALGIDESGSGSSGPVKHKLDLSSLFSAVQSGDLTAAQSAWSQIQANRAQAADQDGDHDGSGAKDGMAKDITSLLTAVSSGDTSGMQAAATAVAKDMQDLLGQPAKDPTSAATPTDPRQALIDDLNAVVTAAQSGDAASAQSAQQKLVQDLQAMEGPGRAHGHHHHHHEAAPATPAPAAASTDGTTPVTAG